MRFRATVFVVLTDGNRKAVPMEMMDGVLHSA